MPFGSRARLVAAGLWFCVTIVLASYSATIFSFLTVSKQVLPFSSIEQVANDQSYVLQVYEGALEALFKSTFMVRANYLMKSDV